MYVYNVTTTPFGSVPPYPCSSNYGGGNAEVDPDGLTPAQKKQYFEQELIDSHTAYTGVQSLYTSLLDGGNTDAVQSEIAMAWPEDMWELRAELLGLSPLLSKDVLVSASDRTDVLPESIIFEVLSANPDELKKKKELMEHLETKDNPLPEYMIEILESLTGNVTYKTILQSQMAHYGRMEGRATGILLRDMVRDSTTTPESIRTFYGRKAKSSHGHAKGGLLPGKWRNRPGTCPSRLLASAVRPRRRSPGRTWPLYTTQAVTSRFA